MTFGRQMLYGDPLAQKAFLEAFTGLRPSPQDFMSRYGVTSAVGYAVGVVLVWTIASVTGVFGPVRGNDFLFFPLPVYVGMTLLALVGALGFLRYWRRAGLADWQRQSWWLSAFFGALLLASFIRFNFAFFQAQARYLFPVLPAAALALCLGLQQLVPEAWRPRLLVLVVAGLAVLAAAGIHSVILPGFESS